MNRATNQAAAIRLSVRTAPQPLPVCDGLLAATCLEHGLTMVTRNAGDFIRSGVPTLNPFEAANQASRPAVRRRTVRTPVSSRRGRHGRRPVKP